jgi:hypothetical protein
VMALDEALPGAVTERGLPLGRTDHVGEQHRGKDGIELRLTFDSQEPLENPQDKLELLEAEGTAATVASPINEATYFAPCADTAPGRPAEPAPAP